MATQGALSQAIVLHDTLIQLFPGGDHPELPRDTLVRLPARWEPPACTSAVPSSMLICTAQDDTCVAIDNAKMRLPFTMCMMIQGDNEGAADDLLTVQWWVPDVASAETFKRGTKKLMIDIFGPWKPLDARQLGDLGYHKTVMPPVLIPRSWVLLINVELEDGRIPFAAFDELRVTHGVDTTALSTSSTHYGNLYRAHVLMRG